MGQRRVVKLYDFTSAAAGAADSSVLTVESLDAVIVYFVAAGAAAPTGTAVKPTLDDNTELTFSLVLGVGATGVATFCNNGPVSGVGQSLLHGGPVPRRLKVVGSGGAASTLRIAIYGVQSQ